jgi:glycosyltransferase involved in cell wall biosynthesis
MLERWYMQIFMRSHYKLVVQTDEMRRKVIRRFPKNHVLVDKFFPRVEWPNPTENRATEVRRIVYVGGAEKYKNFQNTLDAVKEFSALTIQASQLVVIGNVDYESITDSCVEVIHHDKCSHDLTLHEIASSDLLIFASECESFGMPLWEAYSLGIPILAADRSYVFESCVPSHVFDPNNVSSIVNALCLHYGISRVMEPHSRTLTMGVLESG